MFSSLPIKHRLLIGAVSSIIAVLLLIPSEQASASRNTETSELEVGKRYSLEVPMVEEKIAAQQLGTLPQEDNSLEWVTVEVKKGDNLSSVFKKANLDQTVMRDVLSLGKEVKTLTRIFPGEQIEFGLNNQGLLQEIRYPVSNLKTLRVQRNAKDKFFAEELLKEVEVRTEIVSGVINGSFWNAGLEAGLSESQMLTLANSIFSYDIDFGLDIKAGDSFSVLFETKYADGQFVGNGDILAAQFRNEGTLYQAIKHKDGGYYKPDGKAMRQAFLRAPVSFQYVSSNFNPKRFHPVLKKVRPHNGVDYVAAVGTPIMAAGDGKVIASTYNGVNGNYVFVQHKNNIVTKYLHLSKRDVKQGETVRQGQVIGRLGGTGRVTGAHLHYEFVVGGVHRNPRTVKLPQAEPLSNSDRLAFVAQAQQLIAQLDTYERSVTAAAE
ncbi:MULTISPECIES: peptidoglycan DD-metalloendopeptidase family protein [Rheinheimera]|uniref:Peptidoglycan DD-metalloendopeptidase family protein n=1 Tax=Rheinheimera marina TaxID=1774958 RepID=A0ABV9JNF4_9GAMM